MMLKSSIGMRLAARPTRLVAARQLKAQAARETWYPGATPPAHLNGTIPGDYGFDPLLLGKNPDTLKYFAEAEITNGRWAMTAVVGILVADLLGRPKFWEAGAETYPIDTQTLAVIEIGVFGVLESLRYDQYKKTGSLTTFIDPLNMTSEQTKLKEVKNGRLAMLAFVGFFSSAAVNGLGPIDSLTKHLADPTHNNIFTSSVGPESAVTVAVLSVWPIIIEATKALRKGEKADVPALFPWAEPWKN